MLKYIAFSTALPIVTMSGFIAYKSKIPKKDQLHIVFDLDHTLIHAERISKFNNIKTTHIRKPDGEGKKYFIWKRPFLVPILWSLSKFNNLHLMTRSTKDYSSEICTILDIDKYFTKKYVRGDPENGEMCKDVSTIDADKHINKFLLVDDLKSNCCSGQKFYHIPQYLSTSQYDIALLKLYFYILFRNIKGEF